VLAQENRDETEDHSAILKNKTSLVNVTGRDNTLSKKRDKC
jgi:hypothetical protein